MKFLDNVVIQVLAGRGGNGISSFRREKFIEFGGPDGGDGGNGGDVILQSKENINTLVDFRYKKTYKARNGESGGPQRKTGARGEDLVLTVPVGTQVISEYGSVLFDFTSPNLTYVLAKGGQGGKGNYNFKSSTNRTPRYSTKGEDGDELTITLQLKLIADVGLIGMPNAGKSTFLSTVTNARPKVADYPFTTLTPGLGIYRHDLEHEIVIADIPGILEGAHSGIGLGDKFLAHVERCRVLLHLVDLSEPDPVSNYEIIREELKSYGANLAEKEEIIVLTKSDLSTDIPEFFASNRHFLISCFSGDGVKELMSSLIREVNQQLI